MGKERNYDNDGLDPSEEYFKKKGKGNDEDTYFPLEDSEPPHYLEWILRNPPPKFWYIIERSVFYETLNTGLCL